MPHELFVQMHGGVRPTEYIELGSTDIPQVSLCVFVVPGILPTPLKILHTTEYVHAYIRGTLKLEACVVNPYSSTAKVTISC